MTTRLVILRHAKPVSENYEGDDFLRPLSEEGKKTQEKTIQWLKEQEIVPFLILSSPFLRAKQTANLVAEAFTSTFQEEEALSPEFDKEKMIEKIPPPDQNATCFLVGHEPSLSQFIHELVGEEILPQGLSKSSACMIEFENEVSFGKGRLIALYSPSK